MLRTLLESILERPGARNVTAPPAAKRLARSSAADPGPDGAAPAVGAPSWELEGSWMIIPA